MRNIFYLLIVLVLPVLLYSRGRGSEDPYSPKAKKLGEKLFQANILSSNNQVSCASCHKPAHAFADTVAFSEGVNGARAVRNTPSAMNVSGRPYFFFDGRAATLEQQAIGPIENPLEMNLPFATAVKRLQASAYWTGEFKKAFGHAPDSASLLHSLAAFEKSLETAESLFDLSRKGKAVLPADAEEGRKLFNGKAGCFDCHMGVDFTADEFRNIGLYNSKNLADEGRGKITGDPADKGKFKVPGLRNVAVTAPYMHNGMFATLEQVIDYYNRPGSVVPDAVGRDTLVHDLGLTEVEKKQLQCFLERLTDRRFLNKR